MRLPATVADHFGLDPGTAKRVPPGFSGATVWHVSRAENQPLEAREWSPATGLTLDTGQPQITGRRAVKCWPEGTTDRRVSRVHRVVRDCRVMPPLDQVHGQTFIRHGDRVFESAAWIDAIPTDPGDHEGRDAGVELIARFHQNANWGASWSSGPSDVLAHRDAVLQSELDRLKLNQAGISDWSPLRQHRRREVRVAGAWIERQLGPQLCQIRDRLSRAKRLHGPVGWVLRDVHRSHILFRGGRPVTIIDGDAIRPDWPLVDLARWVGSFELSGDELHSVASTTLGRYHQAAADGAPQWSLPMTDQVNLLADLIRVSTLLTFVRWTRWLWIEDRPMNVAFSRRYQRWQSWAHATWMLCGQD